MNEETTNSNIDDILNDIEKEQAEINDEFELNQAGVNQAEEDSTSEVSRLKIELEESKDKYLRLFAEFDNFKKRTMKEKLDLMKTAAQDTIASLLPVADDFERAKKASDAENSTEKFSEGVTLVYNKFVGILTTRGLRAMESTGEDFDVEKHEAVTEIPAFSPEMVGKVVDTIEKGYYLNDKIIRYAKVVVGK
jgi:molecular chaperone GrpE